MHRQFKNNFFPEPFSQQLRALKLRELPARFFEGLSNPFGTILRAPLGSPSPEDEMSHEVGGSSED